MSLSKPLHQPGTSTTSRKRQLPPLSTPSSLAGDAPHDFFLLPSLSPNFVIHYRSASFHVHRSVLDHHSAYFRAYFEMLEPSIDETSAADNGKGMIPTKRRRVETTATTSPSSTSSSPSANANAPNKSSTCSHPTTIACIHLPNQCGINEATVEVFLSFLRHLYFPSHYRYPPLQPDPDVEEALSHTKLSISPGWPRSKSAPQSLDKYSLHALSYDAEWQSGLLSLLHYVDCQQALYRCEQIILTDIVERNSADLFEKDSKEEKQEDEAEDEDIDLEGEEGVEMDCAKAKQWLPVAARFGLKMAEKACDSAIHHYLYPSLPYDLVLHYREASFFVHRSVLGRHSSFFCTHFGTTQPASKETKEGKEKHVAQPKVEPLSKKRKVASAAASSSSSSASSHASSLLATPPPSPAMPTAASSSAFSTCSHPSTIPCIHLPPQCGIEGAPVTLFLAFLRHLYFPRHYRYPPLRPNWEAEDVAGYEELPISHNFPWPAPTPPCIDDYADRNDRTYCAGLLSLFCYFDCRQALQRCERVITGDVVRNDLWDYGDMADVEEKVDEEKGDTDEATRLTCQVDFFDGCEGHVILHDSTRAWEWLNDSGRFGLKNAEKTCIEVIGGDTKIRGGGRGKLDYELHVRELPVKTVVRVMERMSRRLGQLFNMVENSIQG